MADRRAELERKKLKLQQLREMKEGLRSSATKERALLSDFNLATGNNVGSSPRSLTSSIRTDMSDADQILSSVGISSGRASGDINANNTNNSSDTTNNNEPTSTSGLANNHDISSTNTITTPAPPPLSLATYDVVLIPPKEHVTYEKQTQTISTNVEESPVQQPKKKGALDYYVLTYDDLGGDEDESMPYGDGGHHQSSQTGEHGGGAQDGHGKSVRISLPHVEMVRPAQTEEDQAGKREEPKIPKRLEYKEEERRHIMQTDAFQKFIDRAVRITERALACTDSLDIFVDYTGQAESVDSEDKSGMRLSLSTTFVDERWSSGRTVTSFDWCTEFPELLVTGYNSNEERPNDPDGICLVWNMKFKKTTPEYVFHCQSPVMSASFAKFHPNLIIGGTYSGQIVLWDNRSGKRGPVQRSPLSSTAHTHPVYCLRVVGTQNSHNLISISNEGKLCSWSLDMLSQPMEPALDLQKQSRIIAVTSLSFPVSDYNNFIIGSQDGTVYSGCRHGAKQGILDIYEGHQGPVTAVDFHQASSTAAESIDLSHLYLTSSFDWTFKLWSMKETKPLYSFEDGSDYIYDIRWSPIHPAVFATVDGQGMLNVWNLNLDTELPTVSVAVDQTASLNRCIWSPNGQQIVVGGDNGKVWVYDVGEQLAFPKNDEWARFAHTLQEFNNNNIEV